MRASLRLEVEPISYVFVDFTIGASKVSQVSRATGFQGSGGKPPPTRLLGYLRNVSGLVD